MSYTPKYGKAANRAYTQRQRKRREAERRRYYGQTAKRGRKKKSGCYVATAVYGSYDCPQVWTLRRYRDYTLSESRIGRTFIACYYAISPLLVKWFGDASWFKKLLKPILDRMVQKLNDSGVESTPYSDRV